MPLGPPDFYKEQSIDLALRTDVAGIDAKARHVILASGRSVPFDKLLLATRSGKHGLRAASLPLAPQRSSKMLSDRKYEELVAELMDSAKEIANDDSDFLTDFRGFARVMWSDDYHMKDVDASRNENEAALYEAYRRLKQDENND